MRSEDFSPSIPNDTQSTPVKGGRGLTEGEMTTEGWQRGKGNGGEQARGSPPNKVYIH